MYGTVMIGTLNEGVDRQQVLAGLRRWKADRAPAVTGYRDEWVLFGDDGRTVVSPVRFATRDDYARLADDPAQDEWWRSTMAPLLAGDPQWIDGSWEDV